MSSSYSMSSYTNSDGKTFKKEYQEKSYGVNNGFHTVLFNLLL